MAQLPPYRRIGLEDIKGAPPWIESLIYILNNFMEVVYGALNRNLSFSENFRAELKTFTITAGATADLNKFRFTTALKNKPSGVLPMSVNELGGNYVVLTAALSIPSWRWESGEIIIESITGLTSTKQYTITVLVIYN
ncbi:MAG: hypothetical protein LUO93_11425 [Methanomicrobiales archaeon]|nr:hypothetical protein [Methanomicrobiales archaeon]